MKRKPSRRNIVILGSTGSIGTNALDVARRMKDRFRIVGLAANRSVDAMMKQIREFKPDAVAVDHTPSADALRARLARGKSRPRLFNHADGLERLAAHPRADFVLCGIVGARGLLPLVAALKAGKTVGLANKEALIVAGEIIMGLSRRHNAPIIPVDSEHSAIFQCLKGQNHGDIRRLILTASGGPFYRHKGDLDAITVDQALNHPTWKMGAKITVDSATLMNKGLEAIEAHHLFGVPMSKISIVIHPQSIVHSLVEFEDGALLAQLSHPDMRLPIQYALTYPDRARTPIRRLEMKDVGALEFAQPDFSRFPCLKLALDAGNKGGTAPTALSSANEAAVRAFIARRISFMSIPKVVAAVVRRHAYKKRPALDDVLKIDRWARDEAERLIKQREKN